jgi:hypothetical protein
MRLNIQNIFQFNKGGIKLQYTSLNATNVILYLMK